jgi:hypothetical protein
MDDMTRQQLLKIALIAIGAIFFTIYPLGLIWPSGWQRHGGHGQYYLQLICGVYAVLGAYLIAAARNPSEHRSLISFTVWQDAPQVADWTCNCNRQCRQPIETGSAAFMRRLRKAAHCRLLSSVTIAEAEEVLGRLLDPRFLTIIGCWFIASAVLDYETPTSFNILYCLATLAPLALVWAWRVWASRDVQSTPSSQP